MVHIPLSLHYGLCVSFLFGLSAFGESSKMLKLPESTTMRPHKLRSLEVEGNKVSAQSPTGYSDVLRSQAH